VLLYNQQYDPLYADKSMMKSMFVVLAVDFGEEIRKYNVFDQESARVY
jgi:hypothetical protein